MFFDALYLLFLGLSTLLIQLIGLPIVITIFGKKEILPEWWAWGRLTGWLAIGLPIWLLGHLKIPINTTVGFWLVAVALGVGLYGLKSLKMRQLVRNFLHKYSKEILFQEILFLTGFIFLGLVRTFQPTVIDLEKFMNAGLMQGYLRSPVLPAIDMWLSGEFLNYYSFGHFLGSLLLRFWNLPLEVGFNILPGWMMGLIFMESSALTQTLLRKFSSAKKHFSLPLIVAGVVGAVLIVFGGNSHPLWYLWTNKSLEGYWYPEAVRLIEHTIHEIPAYSFIVSDLHAHFWSLSVVLFTIFTVYQWLKVIFFVKKTSWLKTWQDKTLLRHNLALGVLLAVLGMTNTWDMLIYGILLLILGALTIATTKMAKLRAVIVSGVQVGIMAGIIFLSWFWNFSTITKGVFFVTEQSPLWQLLVLWSGHVILSAIAVIISWRVLQKKISFHFPVLFLIGLAVSAWLFLLLPEFIYFKDIYPTYPRANTMFKFTYQSFIIMSILIGWLVGFLLEKKNIVKKYLRWILLSLVGLFTILASLYAVYGYRSYYGNFKNRTDWNGLSWLENESSVEYEAILWLRDNTDGRPVVLEAVGDSYTTNARVSVFTGLPTLMGWRAHEWLWRGGYDITVQRAEIVSTIYERPESLQAEELLNKHQVEFIFIGSKEREQYNFVLQDLLELGEVVFQRGNVIILKR